ncbi:hypothetical protein ACKKBF_B40245 [Auxenochlorella protothecoides x Auxenochlorella symbiontica]
MASNIADKLKLACIVRALFPTPATSDGTKGDSPSFDLKVPGENSAGYCLTILPDFGVDRCLMPYQAYLVLLIVANSLSIHIEPSPS